MFGGDKTYKDVYTAYHNNNILLFKLTAHPAPTQIIKCQEFLTL